MKNTGYELNDMAMENVVGGNTIKPNDSSFWYSYNPEFAYNWGDNWGDEGYFRNN